MFVTTIIPTIGRPSLERAVLSVLEQELDADFEVIVVNDSGEELAPASWQSSPKIRIINTRRRERSIARNTGAAVATGKYLHFLDDDDWLIPDALKALKELAEVSGGLWLYGSSQLVDRNGEKLIELHHQMKGNVALQVMAGEWIPLQSSLFDVKLFFDIGGFDPLIPGAEDVDLTRRVALETLISGTDQLIACIGMGHAGSTTDYERSSKMISARRERLLEGSGTFRKLLSSATSAYWSGRMTRIYLTSVLFNLSRGNVTTAISRLGFGLISIIISLPRILSPDYWNALVKTFRNETFIRGFQAAGREYWSGTGG